MYVYVYVYVCVYVHVYEYVYVYVMCVWIQYNIIVSSDVADIPFHTTSHTIIQLVVILNEIGTKQSEQYKGNTSSKINNT